MRCLSFCTAKQYSLSDISQFFKALKVKTKFYKSVLHLNLTHPKADVFIFSDGCFVTWGLTHKQEIEFQEQIHQFSIEPLTEVEKDFFSFRYSDETHFSTHERFNVDIIALESNSVQLKLAISYALAQSVKLESHEESIKKTIDENRPVPLQMSAKGTTALNRKAICKHMGRILMEKSRVNLYSDFLDVPEFFWQMPNLEQYYLIAEKYLDISNRVTALNVKLDLLHDTFDILNVQLQHSHSSFLEWIIIILIAIEIVFSVAHSVIA